MTETLCCLPANHVDTLGLGEGFTPLDSGAVERLLTSEQLWLGPRNWLETDERFRQLVSYMVVSFEDQVLVYRRTKKGGEGRLHGLLSLGVGGHVNIGDVSQEGEGIDPTATVFSACQRELGEEIRVPDGNFTGVLGIIKQSDNEVSRVHLGVVVGYRTPRPEVTVIDPGLTEARFVSPSALPALVQEMETWSASLVSFLVGAAR